MTSRQLCSNKMLRHVPRLTCLLSVIINYSSNERAYIHPVLSECSQFADEVIVSYGSHLLDGTAEDKGHILNLQSTYPTVKFVEYHVNLSVDMYSKPGVVARPTAYWHNLARWTAIQNIMCKNWVFVIDTDEIPDGKLVRPWSQVALPHLEHSDCFKFANFWYFKEAIYQATTLEDSPLLIHYTHLTKSNVFGDLERGQPVAASGCNMHAAVTGFDGSVLWHHFSWVRSRAGLEHKLKHWAHADDMFHNVNASELVAMIFRDENVNDVVHHYKYVVVNNTFNIQLDY